MKHYFTKNHTDDSVQIFQNFVNILSALGTTIKNIYFYNYFEKCTFVRIILQTYNDFYNYNEFYEGLGVAECFVEGRPGQFLCSTLLL